MLRALSWNVWWRFGDQWQDRQRGILATLQDLRPDVIGLQESWGSGTTSQAEELAGKLGMYPAFAGPSLPPVPQPPERPDQEGIELGVSVISRWPILNVRRELLPARHRHQPVALIATIDHPAGPLHFVASCVEWEPDYADDHLAQTRALAELLTDPALDGPLPVLLSADLNAPPDSPEIAVLNDVLVDTWVAGGGDPATVTLSSQHPDAPLAATKQIDQRIDYVFARPGSAGQELVVDRSFIAGDPVDGLYPSDHFAVVADLQLPSTGLRTSDEPAAG
jgi:endonuclease/exonuclease/phosphatase family metal-dependent hydrolase